jgi:hypothetical protein
MHECVHTNVGLNKRIKTPEATHELMTLAASSHVLHNRTTESPDPHMVKKLMVPDTSNLGCDIGSADAPQDKVLTQFSPTKRAPSPVSTQLMVLDTSNLGGDIGSADAPHDKVLTQFLPMKRAPTPVIANKHVYSTPPFCPIATYEDMRRQMTVEYDIQQKNIVTALETIQPGKRGHNIMMDAVEKMVSLLFNV